MTLGVWQLWGVGEGAGGPRDQTRLERGATCRLPKAAHNRTERQCKMITEKSIRSGDLQRRSRKELSEEDSFRRQEQKGEWRPCHGSKGKDFPLELSLAVGDL